MTAPTTDAVAQARQALLDAAHAYRRGDVVASDVTAAADALIRAVEARVRAECAADTKRLDWIERNEAETVFTGDTSGDWCVRYGKISVSTLRKSNRADADSLRDAIDAAMEAHP